MGSFSKLMAADADESRAMELFYDGGFFGQARFNNALKALGMCVAELARHISHGLRLPYEMSPAGDRVGGASLQASIGTKDEEWTEALSYLACNLKWLCAFVVQQDARNE